MSTSESHPGPLAPGAITFVLLAFEGPDAYARAGGLGVRVTGLSHALAEQGYPVHLLFVGDPAAPGCEARLDGSLTLHRWCQWISAYHGGGVYDGEEGKVADFSASAPGFVAERLVRPATEAGRLVVVMAEEWQTAEAVCRLHDLLREQGLREHVVLLWNANNTIGFDRIDWIRLQAAATLTTVSRYMKHLLWSYGVNPLVIPNGLAAEQLREVASDDASIVRRSVGERPLLVKVARWDPDKRWLLAIDTVASLKAHGQPAVLVARGGVEVHGGEVLDHAARRGLRVRDVVVPPADTSGPRDYAAAFAGPGSADVLNVTTPMAQPMLGVLYRAADGVLANSGREPFGLVGLETMAAGGTAYTGNTGEEYVRHLHNAVVLDTDDPEEAAWYVGYLDRRADEQAHLRERARETALRFAWGHVIEELLARAAFVAARQGAPVGGSPGGEAEG